MSKTIINSVYRKRRILISTNPPKEYLCPSNTEALKNVDQNVFKKATTNCTPIIDYLRQLYIHFIWEKVGELLHCFGCFVAFILQSSQAILKKKNQTSSLSCFKEVVLQMECKYSGLISFTFTREKISA